MRDYLRTAFFALVSLASYSAVAQGRMHIVSLSGQSFFENKESGDEIVAKALAYDSIRTAESIVFYEDTVTGWQKWTTVGNHTFGKDRGDMPMITDVNALHPFFRDKVQQLIAICKERGIELAFVETYRTHAKQAEYKGMGKKYTRSGAGKSKHQYGFAVDVVPIVNDTACWHDKVLWKRVGIVGEKLGLRWGGRWRHPYDPGHFEWTGGLNTQDLAYGAKPLIPKEKSLYPCLDQDIKQLKKFWAAWEAQQGERTDEESARASK
jgi:D-alanyl-D-alanine carboxypeptidase